MSTLPLYALPGLLNDARMWQHQVAALSTANPVKVADLSGYDTITALAQAALAEAPAHRFALAGFSMGGYVALEIMRQAPERVAGLALVDTSARPDTKEATENRRKLIEQSASDFDAVVASFPPKLLHASQRDDVALVTLLNDMAFAIGREAFVRQQNAIIGRLDSRPHLAKINCPTLVVVGRDDAITPLDVAQEMATGIKGSKLVVIEQSGHMSPLGQAADVTKALTAWLSALHA